MVRNDKKNRRRRSADCHANMEQNTGDGSIQSHAIKEVNPPVRIKCIHYRHRLVDPDGLSVKAAIDAIVEIGLLRDDSAKEVKEIVHKQIKIGKTEEEKTIFQIEEV